MHGAGLGPEIKVENEISVEFCRLRSVEPDWTPALLRVSAIDSFSFKWGMAKDEVTEIVDSYPSLETQMEALNFEGLCAVKLERKSSNPRGPHP